MIVDDAVVNRFGRLVREAERRTLESINSRRTEEEPSITDRFFGALETVFDEHRNRGRFRLTARTLPSHGPNAAERRFGADVVVVLHINVDSFREDKGFLAQAKMSGNGIDVARNNAAVSVASVTATELMI